MRDSIRIVTLLAGCLAAACGPSSKSKQPVITTTEQGKATSPAGVAADKRGVTLVRVVNALPDKRPVDVAADKRVLFTNVGYDDVSDYAELPENVARFTVRAAGSDSALAENREVMGDGARYTLVALSDKQGAPQLTMLKDELATDSTRAKLRVVNAAPGLEDVKVTIAGQPDPLFDHIALGTPAGYRDLAPNTATLLFQPKKGGPVVKVEQWKLEPGRSYTVVLTGAAGQKVTAVKFDDRPVRPGDQVSLKP